jgi:hypothetical protein
VVVFSKALHGVHPVHAHSEAIGKGLIGYWGIIRVQVIFHLFIVNCSVLLNPSTFTVEFRSVERLVLIINFHFLPSSEISFVFNDVKTSLNANHSVGVLKVVFIVPETDLDDEGLG